MIKKPRTLHSAAYRRLTAEQPSRRAIRMLLRRALGFALSLALLSAAVPSPAAAGLSTGQEVQLGKQTDKQVTDSTNVVTDPLLNAWVNGITTKLWAQVARKDVPYNIKILDVTDVNAFSTLGGYVYVNEGTLDFVQSDDELAGVLGHETGHIERRHAVTSQSKETLVDALLMAGSLFAPYLAPVGQLLGQGAMAKISRGDETEADRYGLMLMARAGYDPAAMVSFMGHLGAVEADTDHDFLDKYLADHPGVPNRISHLVGYPELDPAKRTADQREAAALHNLDEARYAIAAREFSALLKTNAGDTVAMYHLGEAQLALGQTSKGEQNLAQAAATGTPQTRTLALGLIHGLRDSERRFVSMRPNLGPLRASVAQAQADNAASAAALAARRDGARDQLKVLSARISDIENEMPDLSRVQARHGGQLDAVLHNLSAMGRSLDTAIGKAQATIGGVGSLERNKEAGLLKENADMLVDLSAPLKLDEPPPQSLATLAFYPRMLGDISDADSDITHAVDGSLAAMTMLNASLGDLDKFVRALARVQYAAGGGGDIPTDAYKTIEPLMTAATDSLSRAAAAASQANQLYMMARARQLMAQIDMLGLASSPDRYTTLVKAIDVRFANDAPNYDELLHENLSPGEVTAAAIVAADTNVSPAVIEADAKSSHRSVVDVANTRGMSAEALEIMLGLVLLDYIDDPDKEARGRV
jgi:Zn-dependent protease with chaperone function